VETLNFTLAIATVIAIIVREHPELHYNRQQFIECAIRDKIEKTQQIKARNSNTSS